jgi:hypothetical protein
MTDRILETELIDGKECNCKSCLNRQIRESIDRMEQEGRNTL